MQRLAQVKPNVNALITVKYGIEPQINAIVGYQRKDKQDSLDLSVV